MPKVGHCLARQVGRPFACRKQSGPRYRFACKTVKLGPCVHVPLEAERAGVAVIWYESRHVADDLERGTAIHAQKAFLLCGKTAGLANGAGEKGNLAAHIVADRHSLPIITQTMDTSD